VALPEIKSISGDTSKVEITVTTDPALVSDDFLQVDGSNLMVDFNEFSALDYSSSLATLKTQAQALVEGFLESSERLSIEVSLTLEEDGVALTSEVSFTLEIATSLTIIKEDDS